eukprot:4848294-Lingulodinium_polyedra.AAC.1
MANAGFANRSRQRKINCSRATPRSYAQRFPAQLRANSNPRHHARTVYDRGVAQTLLPPA